MNYTLSHIKIKSNWFDERGKYSKVGYKGFYIYLTLFKFRLHRQIHDYHFITSLALLRKETGYSTIDILENIKLMKKLKMVSVENVSRWDYLLDQDGKIKDKEVLIIVAADAPQLVVEDKNKETPETEGDYYISVDLDLMEYYKNNGLNEKYYGVYCLMKKLSNGNPESKAYMTIENMSIVLGYDKDCVNRMVLEMNKRRVLYSDKRKNKKKGYNYEHYLCHSLGKLEEFKLYWKGKTEEGDSSLFDV